MAISARSDRPDRYRQNERSASPESATGQAFRSSVYLCASRGSRCLEKFPIFVFEWDWLATRTARKERGSPDLEEYLTRHAGARSHKTLFIRRLVCVGATLTRERRVGAVDMQKIWQLVTGYQAARALLAADELGVVKLLEVVRRARRNWRTQLARTRRRFIASCVP